MLRCKHQWAAVTPPPSLQLEQELALCWPYNNAPADAECLSLIPAIKQNRKQVVIAPTCSPDDFRSKHESLLSAWQNAFCLLNIVRVWGGFCLC